ncbi:MAG TPA: S9 family peptidase [Candidatus Acidoferrales bacterium]|nr:S9 family peptidase [Candidatus Acidoferrales bacterium]
MKISARTISRVLAACVIISAMAATTPVSLQAQEQRKRAITFQDLISMHRVSEPQVSPDGKWIAYSVSTPDLDANRSVRNIWIVASSGGEARQLTRGGTDTRPRWSPDGKKLAFLSARVENNPQVFWMNLEGGEATKVTSLSTGADNELWSPDGKAIAFISSVYPDCKDDSCNAGRDAEKEKSKVKARIYDKLLYRHWTGWSDGKRSHLFLVLASGGTPRDLTPGANYDVPPFNLGAPEPIAFSPDSRELCFTANTDKDEALSTNGDLFTVPVSGASEPKRITTNPGDDWGPAYSPNGMWIAYRAQMQPGYESDRWRLMLYARQGGKQINLTETFDSSVESYAFAPDSKSLYFNAEDKGEMPIYSITAAPGSSAKVIISGNFNQEFDVSEDGRTLAIARTSLTMPAEIFAANSDGSDVRQLTHQNAVLLSQLDLAKPEIFKFEGAEKTPVEGFVIRPPHFDPLKKYPALLLIHGGPQGAWTDAWGYRWNEQLMAAPGYVVLAINPRGSTGYGQKFTAEVSRDWGGKAHQDLMKGLDAAIAKYSFIDGSRVGAAGGSYGGYMIDWIATHTGRFKCLISHAGPYDAVSMGATEELWFSEWEFGGTPWANPELYRKWSPSEFASALGKYKTPTLVVGGELDFRVPYTQDLEFFAALQRQGVPSKLLIFPDEGHWVLKPQNSELWYKTFLGWLAEYLK